MTLRNDVKFKTLLVAVFAAIAMILSGTVATPDAHAENSTSREYNDYATIGYGSSGDNVSVAQIFLRRWGYYSGPIDGLFGSGTKNAVMSFQSGHKLTIDGWVGPNTWNRIQRPGYYGHQSHVYSTSGTATGERCEGWAVMPDHDFNRCYFRHTSSSGSVAVKWGSVNTGWHFWNFEDGCWITAVSWRSCY